MAICSRVISANGTICLNHMATRLVVCHCGVKYARHPPKSPGYASNAVETFLLLFSGGVIKPAPSKNNATSSETNFPPGFLLYRCGSMVGTKAMFTEYMGIENGEGW